MTSSNRRLIRACCSLLRAARISGCRCQTAVLQNSYLERRNRNVQAAGNCVGGRFGALTVAASWCPSGEVAIARLHQRSAGLHRQHPQLHRFVGSRFAAAKLLHLDAVGRFRKTHQGIHNANALFGHQHRIISGLYLRDQCDAGFAQRQLRRCARRS